jgi:GT2 family glycosyltransferase
VQNYKFTVIIPTCGRKSLIKCLEKVQLAINEIKPVKCQVIVTDDKASVRTKINVRNLNSDILYIVGPQKGPAANRNKGAKYAKGNWLIFTDDDCLPDLYWMSEIQNVIKNTGEETIALEGSILPVGDASADMADCPVNNNGGCFWSANIAVRRKIFEEVKGFDENFPIAAFEDTDLFLRLQEKGNIEFLKNAKVFHPVRRLKFWSYFLITNKRLKSWIYLQKKHIKNKNLESESFIIGLYKLFLVTYKSFKEKKWKFCSMIILRIIVYPVLFLFYNAKYIVIEKSN